MLRLRRFLLASALLLLAGGAVTVWHLLGNRPPVVEVAAVARGPSVEAVYATGTVEPVNWARVEAVQRGRLIELPAREGDRVSRGDVLARLDDSQIQARLRELTAQSQFLRAELDRQDELARRGVATAQARQRAESELGQVLASIAGVRSQLDDYVLRAPLAGVVLRRDAEVGEVARIEEVLFWIGQPKPLWAVVDVDEEDIPLIRQGQRTLIKADAFPGRVLEGTVDRITLKGDPVNKTYRVRVALPEDTPLMIGMTVEANIIVRQDAATLLVPDTAVGNGRVFVIGETAAEGKTARVHARLVEVGVVGEGKAEIRGGLSEGEPVVVNPPASLRDGGMVRIVR